LIRAFLRPTIHPQLGERAMAYWLIKSEPSTWSWDQHAKAGADAWTGVRNHQAKAHLKAMTAGDEALYYHSGDDKAAVGISKVVRPAYPDPTDASAAFVAVDFAAERPLARPVTLSEIKSDAALKDMVLVKNARLSVQPVAPAEWRRVLELGGLKP
jgi:predicted RNA-binding protein with PUA-like domain